MRLDIELPFQRAEKLSRWATEVVICGAISRTQVMALQGRNIQIIANKTGSLEEIISLFLRGTACRHWYKCDNIGNAVEEVRVTFDFSCLLKFIKVTGREVNRLCQEEIVPSARQRPASGRGMGYLFRICQSRISKQYPGKMFLAGHVEMRGFGGRGRGMGWFNQPYYGVNANDTVRRVGRTGQIFGEKNWQTSAEPYLLPRQAKISIMFKAEFCNSW